MLSNLKMQIIELPHLKIDEIQQLRKELISRDNSGLSRIYNMHKADCIRILSVKKICSEESANEIFTEAILVLRKNIISGKITELSNPLSYLVSVCRNLYRADQRKEFNKIKKEQQIISHLYNEGQETTENEDYKEQLVLKCKNGLMKLSERCQQILIAYYVHGLKMKEIALELGLSSSDVAKTLKSRCYKSWINAIKELDK